MILLNISKIYNPENKLYQIFVVIFFFCSLLNLIALYTKTIGEGQIQCRLSNILPGKSKLLFIHLFIILFNLSRIHASESGPSGIEYSGSMCVPVLYILKSLYDGFLEYLLSYNSDLLLICFSFKILCLDNILF